MYHFLNNVSVRYLDTCSYLNSSLVKTIQDKSLVFTRSMETINSSFLHYVRLYKSKSCDKCYVKKSWHKTLFIECFSKREMWFLESYIR